MYYLVVSGIIQNDFFDNVIDAIHSAILIRKFNIDCKVYSFDGLLVY